LKVSGLGGQRKPAMKTIGVFAARSFHYGQLIDYSRQLHSSLAKRLETMVQMGEY